MTAGRLSGNTDMLLINMVTVCISTQVTDSRLHIFECCRERLFIAGTVLYARYNKALACQPGKISQMRGFVHLHPCTTADPYHTGV